MCTAAIQQYARMLLLLLQGSSSGMWLEEMLLKSIVAGWCGWGLPYCITSVNLQHIQHTCKNVLWCAVVCCAMLQVLP